MSSNFVGNPNNFQIEDFIFPEDPSQERYWMRTYLNNMAAAVNSKDSGLYDSTITVTGGQFSPVFNTGESSSLQFRSVLRVVVDTGTLPSSTTSTTAHNITTTEDFTFVKIYGCATDPGASTITSAIPLPYVNTTTPGDSVELNIDATNVNITTTTANYTAYTRSFVVLEYITTL